MMTLALTLAALTVGAAAGHWATIALLPASLRRPVRQHWTDRRICWRDRIMAELVRAMERRP